MCGLRSLSNQSIGAICGTFTCRKYNHLYLFHTYFSTAIKLNYLKMDNEVGGISYLKTSSGYLKILQVIFSSCAFICAMVAGFSWSSSFPLAIYFNVITLMALILAILIIVLCVFNIAVPFGRKIDLITCICFSILIFIAAGLVTPHAYLYVSSIAAVAFQYLNGLAFLSNSLDIVLS